MNEELQLIPINEQVEQTVLVELRKLKFIPTLESFISAYNTGFLNPKLGPVADLANLISDNYKNVTINKQSNKLIVHSREEVAFDDCITMLTNWKLVSSLKRLALAVMNESYPHDTKLLFFANKPGILQLEYKNEETEETVIEPFWQQEKLFSRQSELEDNLFLSTLIYNYNNEGDKFVALNDVIDIDDSFIVDIFEMIKDATFKGE